MIIAQTPPGLVELLTTAAASVPALVVVVLLVIYFLKHLTALEKRHDDRDHRAHVFCETQTETMKGIAGDCKEVMRDNSQAIRENSQALGKLR